MIDRDKYLVFKREDFFTMMGELALPTGDADCAPVAEHIIKRVEETALHDAVVIRKKDSFASSALYAYATAVMTATDILADIGAAVPEDLQHLRELADFFAGEADHARQLHGRIPD